MMSRCLNEGKSHTRDMRMSGLNAAAIINQFPFSAILSQRLFKAITRNLPMAGLLG
jgi:hypothetical protein